MNYLSKLPRVIGITGYKYTGKDTISDYLCKKYGYTRVAFADPLKTICGMLFGFNNEQLHGSLKETADPKWFNLTPRKVLQFVGTELFRNNMKNLHPNFKDEFWVQCTERTIRNILDSDTNAHVVVSDVRFANECDMITRLNGVVIRVDRPNTGGDMHESEVSIATLPVKCVVNNHGSIDDLHNNIDNLIHPSSNSKSLYI